MPAPVDRKQYRSNNIAFSGAALLPALTLLIGSGVSTVTVTPRLTGDVLVPGDCITVTPASRLPAGLNVSYAIVADTNKVEIGFTAAIAVAGSSMTWTVVAHR